MRLVNDDQSADVRRSCVVCALTPGANDRGPDRNAAALRERRLSPARCNGPPHGRACAGHRRTRVRTMPLLSTTIDPPFATTVFAGACADLKAERNNPR